MNPLRHSVIHASAGTGKTYALSGHYLRLLLAGCDPERIIATTFTRKAAGEILDRVLLRLANAALDAQALRVLATDCGHPTLSADNCRDALARLVLRCQKLSIGTLDSFFATIARSTLSQSTGAHSRVLSDAEDQTLRDRALLTALGRVPADSLLRTVGLFCRGTLRSQVLKSLRGRVKELHSVTAGVPAEAWSVIGPRTPPLESSQVEHLAGSLAELEPPLTQQGNPNALWRKSIEEAATTARSGEWDRFLEKGIAHAIAAGAERYARVEITPRFPEAFTPLIENARSVLLGQLHAETMATREFLAQFAAEYEHLKRESSRMTFDDIPRALLDSNACGDLEHLFFQLDTRIDHLLVDEFQDTSAVQFRLLERLIDEITQDNEGRRSFFAVGDVKQSLYQWRNATPTVLLSLSRMFPGVTEEHLDLNRRSSDAVLTAVNTVFTNIARRTALNDAGPGTAAANLWDSTFRAHAGLGKTPGHAQLLTAPRASGTPDAQHAKYRAAAQRAAQLLASDQKSTIGILFQTGKRIPLMAAALQTLGIAASTEARATLADSTLVSLLLSAVRLAQHPGDTAALFHLAHSALAPHLGLSPAHTQPARELSASLRARFLGNGFAPTLAHLLNALRELATPSDHARADQLLALARGYDAEGDATLPGFDRLVRATPTSIPSSDRVRLLTIHGAKGLEFDAVLLPDLDDRFSGNNRELFAIERTPETQEISAVTRKSQLGPLLHPRLAAIGLEADTRRLHERLCVLYVAMTRARNTLDLFINVPPAPAKGTRRENEQFPATFAGLLREALAPDATPEPGTTLWSAGHEPAASPAATPPQLADQQPTPPAIRLLAPTTPASPTD